MCWGLEWQKESRSKKNKQNNQPPVQPSPQSSSPLTHRCRPVSIRSSKSTGWSALLTELRGQLLFWFLDAGMTNPSTRCVGRRPKSAKARSRGKLGTGWQRVLWRINVGADLDDGRDASTTPPGCLQGREVGRAQ